jgi:hypothetical protein
MLGSPFGLPATNRTKGGQTFPFAFSLAGTMQKILTTDDTDDTNDRESRDPRGRGGSAWRVAGSDFPSLLSVQILHPTVLPVYRISETPTTGRATGGRGSQAYGTAERSETDWSAATAAQRARRRARSTLRTKGQSNQLIPNHRSTETPIHRNTEPPSLSPSVQLRILQIDWIRSQTIDSRPADKEMPERWPATKSVKSGRFSQTSNSFRTKPRTAPGADDT